MTTFTITTSQNITQLTPKQGGDTYTISGGQLIVDCDSRYGLNQSTKSVLGNVSVSATTGGDLIFRSSNVRLIPFKSGNGLVPNSGTSITTAGSTCELLCVMSARTGSNVIAPGSAMPATGYLKVRNVVGADFINNATLVGIGVTCSGQDEAGWIVVVGRENLNFTIARLGSLTIDGSWFTVGSTTGTRGQTIQLPHFTSDVQTFYPGVEIETFAGSGVYEFYANVGAKFTSTIVSTDSRSRFVYISTDAIVTIGMGQDAVAAGQLPSAGCAVRVPSIIFQNSTLAVDTSNSTPSTSLGVRYEASFTSAGKLTHNISTGCWFWNIVQPYSVYIKDLHTCDQFILTECATKVIIDRLHVGMSTLATFVAQQPISFNQCYKGGAVGEITSVRAEGVINSGYAFSINNLYGSWTFDKIRSGYASDSTSLSGSAFINACDDVNIKELQTFGKRCLIFSSNKITIQSHIYADNVKSTTQSSNPCAAIDVTNQSSEITVLNFQNWPSVANVHPYVGLFSCNTVKNSSFRYCGSSSVPYDMGTVNVCNCIFNDNGNNTSIKVQRNWVTTVRSSLSTTNNTTSKLFFENNYSVDTNKNGIPSQLVTTLRGNRQNSGTLLTSYVSVYDTHFWDCYTSDTTCLAVIAMNESAAQVGSYSITGGSPKFTSQGSAVLINTGDQIVWTWTYFILGWTGLTAAAATGVNTTNLLFEYDIDKGLGFSGTYKTFTTANVLLETGISYSSGFKLKLRVTCVTANSTNTLTSISLRGTTTLAIQNAAFYPLDTIGLTVTGIIPGTDVIVYQAGTTNVLDTGDSISNDSYTFVYSVPQVVDIGFFCPGYIPYYQRNYSLGITPSSFPINQVFDRAYKV